MSVLTYFHLILLLSSAYTTAHKDKQQLQSINRFSNMALPNIISGNLMATSSDHLPQSLIALNVYLNSSTPRSNKYGIDWSTLLLIIFQLLVIIYNRKILQKLAVITNKNSKLRYFIRFFQESIKDINIHGSE